MADWQNKLDLEDLFKGFRDGEVSSQKFCKETSERLSKLKLKGCSGEFLEELEERRDEIAAEFLSLSEYRYLPDEEVDYCMCDLYDWADLSLDGKFGGKKLCWIASY